MAIFNKSDDNFESDFEQGVTQVKKVTQQTVQQAVKTVMGDVKEQILGGNNNNNVQEKTAAEQMGVKELPLDEKQKAEQQHKRELDIIRMNFDQINKKIEDIRKKKAQELQQKEKVEEKKEEKKKAVEEKKKIDYEKENVKKSGAREHLKGVSG